MSAGGIAMSVEVESTWIGAIKVTIGTHAATANAARSVVEWAQIYVPIDTGELYDSIYAEQESPDEWIVYADTEYAEYVELGTYKMAAQPYMRPALAAAKDEYYAEIAEAFL